MIRFKLPDWLLTALVFFNMWLICFSLIFNNVFGFFLGVFCIGCFIITYKINRGMQYEEEKVKQEHDQGSSFR